MEASINTNIKVDNKNVDVNNSNNKAVNLIYQQ